MVNLTLVLGHKETHFQVRLAAGNSHHRRRSAAVRRTNNDARARVSAPRCRNAVNRCASPIDVLSWRADVER